MVTMPPSDGAQSYDRMYDPVERRELAASELDPLTREKRDELTRRPLTSDQIQALMTTAINLHDRAIAQQQEGRWRVALWTQIAVAVIGFLGVAIGAVIGAVLTGA